MLDPNLVQFSGSSRFSGELLGELPRVFFF